MCINFMLTQITLQRRDISHFHNCIYIFNDAFNNTWKVDAVDDDSIGIICTWNARDFLRTIRMNQIHWNVRIKWFQIKWLQIQFCILFYMIFLFPLQMFDKCWNPVSCECVIFNLHNKINCFRSEWKDVSHYVRD